MLLSKEIESKWALLDREVNYLLNKAKFAKPKPKVNNSTTSESSKANSSKMEEKVILPKEETKDEGGKQGKPTHFCYGTCASYIEVGHTVAKHFETNLSVWTVGSPSLF